MSDLRMEMEKHAHPQAEHSHDDGHKLENGGGLTVRLIL
jgi:hypothetical protein